VDGVHGRADVVTDTGYKIRFRAVRAVGLLHGALEIQVGLLLFKLASAQNHGKRDEENQKEQPGQTADREERLAVKNADQCLILELILQIRRGQVRHVLLAERGKRLVQDGRQQIILLCPDTNGKLHGLLRERHAGQLIGHVGVKRILSAQDKQIGRVDLFLPDCINTGLDAVEPDDLRPAVETVFHRLGDKTAAQHAGCLHAACKIPARNAGDAAVKIRRGQNIACVFRRGKACGAVAADRSRPLSPHRLIFHPVSRCAKMNGESGTVKNFAADIGKNSLHLAVLQIGIGTAVRVEDRLEHGAVFLAGPDKGPLLRRIGDLVAALR